MDAKQGVERIRITNPRTSIPIRYDDYGVFKSPRYARLRGMNAQRKPAVARSSTAASSDGCMCGAEAAWRKASIMR